METQGPDESRPSTDAALSKSGASYSRGVIPDVMRLLGQGVGLIQRFSAKTEDGAVSAGRRAGTFLTAPLKRHAPPIRRARRKRAAKPDSESESRQAGTGALYSRIGERICSLAQLDPTSLLRCLQRNVSVVAARDETDGLEALTLRLSGDAEETADWSESLEKPAAHEEEGESGPPVSEDERDGLERELAEVRGKLDQAEQLICRVHANEIEARERLHEKEESLAAVSRDLEDARHRADDARSQYAVELNSLRSEIESLQAGLTDANTAVDEARTKAEALESDLASARGELDEARHKAQAEQSRLSSQLDAARSETDSLQSDLRDARAQVEDATSQVDHLEAELSALRASMESAGAEEEEQAQPDRGTGGGTEGSTGGGTGDGTGGGTGVSPVEARRPEGSMGILARGTCPTATDLPSDENPAFPDGPADRPAPEPDVEVDAREPAPQVAEEDAPVLERVTVEDVQAADFSGASERVIFARALSDMNLTNKPGTTRARAARSLGSIRHELSARALVVQLRDETSADVRKECIRALTALDAEEGLPLIRWALKDEAASVRLAAVRAIYRLAGSEGAGALVGMLHDEDEDVKRRAATCLGWLGHKSMAAELVPLLRDENTSVRLAGLEALGNLKSSAVVDEIIELLDDPEEPVQKRAFHVLGTISGKRMGETFPEDENGRRFMIARWRARQGRTAQFGG